MRCRQYDLSAFPDAAFQLFCSQIDSDYQAIIRRDIVSCLDINKSIKLRDIRVLMVIDLYNDPVTSQLLSHYLRFDPGTVTRATRCLLQAGYVARLQNEEDGRSPLLSITDKGVALAEQYREKLSDHFAGLAQQRDMELTPEDLELTYKTLLKLSKRSKALLEY